MEAQLGISNGELLKKKIENRLTELNLTQLQKDVQPFLFDPNNQSVSLFPQIIAQTDFQD